MAAIVGKTPPLPLTACVFESEDATDHSSCTVLAHDQGGDASSSLDGWSLDFKPIPDPSCTIARVQEGLCSACTSAAAAEGQCGAGTHTFVVDAVSPDGVRAGETLAVTLHVGSSLLSGEVNIRLEVLADTRGLTGGDAASADSLLQNMLLSSQVCVPPSNAARSHIAFFEGHMFLYWMSLLWRRSL